jgi:hypothetical protein
MDLTLRDDAHTVVHLDIPTEALVNELQNMLPELEKIKTGDRSSVDMIYDLAARLINCNSDFIKVTGQELLTKYRMNLLVTLAFFNSYMGFISELNNQKN